MATCDRRSPEGVEGCAHAQLEVAQWGLFTGSWLQEVTSFSRAFFLVVVQNVGWGVFSKILFCHDIVRIVA
jgi:hypothetical protein